MVIVDTDDGVTGLGEAKGTPVVMKVLVEDVPGAQMGCGVRSTPVERRCILLVAVRGCRDRALVCS
jgi:hypothetical protein